MSKHWKRSRVTKALADSGRVASYEDAEKLLDAVGLVIAVGDDQVATPAGQAAILTAVATARKCFGRVSLRIATDAPLIARLPIGKTLMSAARRLGATAEASEPATHVIRIGAAPRSHGWDLRCWWDRWLAGTRAFDDDGLGDSRLPLAGIFAAALAVRQVFACVSAGRLIRERDATVSLWEPWKPVDFGETGPARFDVPEKLWLAGLGHLGQAFVWALCLLGNGENRLAVLQDDQTISAENEPTSLCVLPRAKDIGQRKTRISSKWMKSGGWTTQLLERRHLGDIALIDDDPAILLSGLDSPEPRRLLATHGFAFMLDAGIGHGYADFEGIQLRTIAHGRPPDNLWEKPNVESDVARRGRILEKPAYSKLDACGRIAFADASVAVPFVGAAAGALTIAQAIRLASMRSTPVLLQLQLSAPEMVSFGGFAPAPEFNLGSVSQSL